MKEKVPPERILGLAKTAGELVSGELPAPCFTKSFFFFNCYTIYTLSKQFPLTKTSYLELFEETIFCPGSFQS